MALFFYSAGSQVGSLEAGISTNQKEEDKEKTGRLAILGSGEL
jgi:hypothetical protein